MQSLNFCAKSFVLVLGVFALTSVTADEKAEKSEKAPDQYKVKFETTCGDFVIEVHRDWAPVGADRFHELVSKEFFNECGFFRVVPDFMVQFGINGDPKIQKDWRDAKIKDDKVTKSNKKGYITFATSGPNSRTSQVFINFADNGFLDNQGFTPFGQVIEGMEVVEKINAQYREKPDQGEIQERGNEYLREAFPKLDFVKKATIVKPDAPKAADIDKGAK